MSSWRTFTAMAGLALRRFVRDRANVFFGFVLPLILVFVIGVQFGEGSAETRVGMVTNGNQQLATELTAAMSQADLVVENVDDETATRRVARGQLTAAVVLPATDADGVRVEMLMSSTGEGSVSARVQQAVRAVAIERAEHAALQRAAHDAAAVAAALAAAHEAVTPATVEVVEASDLAQAFAGASTFSVGAGSQVLLFVFLNSLAASQDLIQSRRLGTIRRALAAPIPPARLLGGLGFGRFLIAFAQGAYIMLASALLFSVSWGNLWASLLVLAAFSAVAAGAALLLGSLLDNEGAAAGAGVGLGLVLAGMGGGMMPLELFPETLRRVANITPHSWGYEAFAAIQRRGAGVTDVLPELGVLAGMAVVVLVAGTLALRRSLARAM